MIETAHSVLTHNFKATPMKFSLTNRLISPRQHIKNILKCDVPENTLCALESLLSFSSSQGYITESTKKVIFNNNADKLIMDGTANIIGLSVDTEEDAVVIAKMFSDYRFETFRVLYLRDGKVIGTDAVSSKLPSLSAIGTTTDKGDAYEFYNYSRKIDRLGADSYCILHNHPSGDADPSSADYVVTNAFSDNVPGFKFSIITGEDNYSVLSYKNGQLINKTFGQYSLNTDQISSYGKAYETVKDYLQEGHFYVLYANAKLKSVALEELSSDMLKNKQLLSYISNMKPVYGASNAFVIADSDLLDEQSEMLLNDGIHNKTITDAVVVEGTHITSMRSANNIFPDRLIVTDNKQLNSIKAYRQRPPKQGV